MSPIADGVGVNGGGFSALFATRGRLLFGVTGGGIASLSASSWAMASTAASSVGADFFCRLRAGCFVSASGPGELSAGVDTLTRADLRKDMILENERVAVSRL